MASQIDLVAIISPKPGKTDRVVELLQEVAEYIKNNEHGTLIYNITRSFNKQAGVEEVIMIESYKDKAALLAHGSSKEFTAFQKKIQGEDLVSAPMQLKITKPAGGFSRL
ncbi:hypothetical protein LSUB1_G007884 [Lachnellula subtilissima]|uniref:ABM domain-containing protein n=1 Tax=Lachnellula subtilissima TaxID=602034 RepID=A0A8H8RCP7_9HELO|nr:hypothetical protein LSUB1_G007884 [Lachnellula subtilissima]